MTLKSAMRNNASKQINPTITQNEINLGYLSIAGLWSSDAANVVPRSPKKHSTPRLKNEA